MISSLDLARICGVSQGTVDRALHDRPGVSAKTKERIQAAAREHGYLPHPATQELLSGSSRILGALVPSLNVLFFMDFLNAVKSACDSAGLRLFITPVADKREFADALADFAARRIAGALAVPPEEGILIPEQIERSLPIATLLSPCANESIPLFAPNERATGEDAVAYLTSLGHERILHVTYARSAFAIDQRRIGYMEAMVRRKLQPKTCIDYDSAALKAVMAEYRPTALFCHNDALAFSVIRTLEADGISVPHEISVLGVDNSPTFNQFQAGITTMEYPSEEVARKAMAWLIDRTDQRPISRLRVVERETTKAFAR